MRTTLTLDEDVATRLQALRQAHREGLKSIINRALRLGLEALEQPQEGGVVYRTRPIGVGVCLLGSLDNVAEAVAVAEGDAYR